MKKIAFVCNTDWFFLSHKIALAVEAKKKGFLVYLIAPDLGNRIIIEDLGIKFIPIKIKRDHSSIIAEISFIFQLIKIYVKIKPDLVHHITIKPCLYGTLALYFVNKKIAIVNGVTGLGYAFIENNNSLIRKIIIFSMRLVYRFNKSIFFIFQNEDDLNLFKEYRIITSHQFLIIQGSGVDENQFKYISPLKKEKLVILFPARMLLDKGIKILIAAANLLQRKYENKVVFQLIGQLDPDNPNGIDKLELSNSTIPNYIEYNGFKKNITEELIKADIVCLPSYYREGLPKVLVEAMAIGRPIVTTNTTGCKDCVIANETGFLVPIKDYESLASALENLILNESLRISMGQKGRILFEEKFTLKKVVDKHFEVYLLLIVNY